MNKNIFLYVFTLILLSSSIFAFDDTNLTHYYAMEDASGAITDSKGSEDSTSQSISEYQVTGINNFAINATDGNITFNSAVVDNLPELTIACWFKLDKLPSADERWWNMFEVGETTVKLSSGTTIQWRITTDASEEVLFSLSINLALKKWYFIVQGYNGTHMYGYLNDTFIGSVAATGLTKMGTKDFVIGASTAGISSLPGIFDECQVYNKGLSRAEIGSLYNGGTGDFFVEAEVSIPTPTIVHPSPEDNSHNNTNVTLNVTHSTNLSDVNYYLYFGTSSSLTETDLFLNNVTRNKSEWRSFTTNVSDGTYYWKWRVQNITDGVFSANTTQRTLIIDTISPTITITANTSFETDNSTFINNFLTENFAYNFSFFDLNLAGGRVIVNITNGTDESVFSILNTSITGTTVNYTGVINTTNWTLGNYTIKLIVIDSHTAKEIEPYGIIKGLDYLRYTTNEGNTIRIESLTIPLFSKTTKLKDRYDFEFNYLFSKNTYKYRITSYNKIDYIQSSDYKAHFVIYGKDGGNWIDFENPNLKKSDYTVTKIDDYTYEVEIKSKGKKKFKFKSIGGLNKVENHYSFKMTSVLDVWVFDSITGNGINVTVTIGTQSNDTIENVRAARLVNITKETTTITLNSSAYGTEIKDLILTSNFHNFSFNMTVTNTINMNFYDETVNTLILGETFSVFLQTTGFSNLYSTTDNPFTVSDLTSGLYRLKASSTNYPERQYLDLNVSNESTTNLNIYLVNTTDSAEKTFNIVDQGLNSLENVRAVFTRVINGTDTIIAQEDSDFAGQVILNLDENAEYTINFSKTDYEDQTIVLEPKNSEYVIQMVSTIGKYNQSVHEGIRYRFEPSDIVLNNNTKYNFTFTLNSTLWTVSNCTLTLKNGSSTLNETSSNTANSCFICIELNTNNMTNITSEARYELDSSFNFTITQQYTILYTYEGDFSLKNFLDDLSDFGMAGFDDFGRMMLALIVIFVITALAAQKVGFTNPEALLLLVIAQVWFFSYVNWLYLGFAPIPTISGFDLKKYIIAILVTLAGGGFVIEKFSK